MVVINYRWLFKYKCKNIKNFSGPWTWQHTQWLKKTCLSFTQAKVKPGAPDQRQWKFDYHSLAKSRLTESLPSSNRSFLNDPMYQYPDRRSGKSMKGLVKDWMEQNNRKHGSLLLTSHWWQLRLMDRLRKAGKGNMAESPGRKGNKYED